MAKPDRVKKMKEGKFASEHGKEGGCVCYGTGTGSANRTSKAQSVRI